MASPGPSTSGIDSTTPANKEIQIVARYVTTPPAVFAHKLKQFLRDNPPPSGHRVTLQWKEVVSPPILRQRQRRERVGAIRPPKGYVSMDFPLLVGNTDDGPQEEQCPYCLCVPCIIVQPPSFLTGSAASLLGNISKRFALYRKFWQLLKELRLWQCDVYLQRKSVRTSTDDPREIIPECIVKEIRKRYPNPDGVPYRDYVSSFEA